MIPTVNVTVAVHGQDGTPVRDALVFARLTTVERYNGYVVAGEYEGRTDERGRAVVAVFPNELGSEGSEYRFKIVTSAGRTFSVYATVPNSDCNLHQICELEPSERRGAGQVVSTEMAGYVTQAETARDKSQEAANRAQAAAVQVDVSAQTATAAASQALSNANAAKRAAEEATGLVQRTETAVVGFESEVIGRVEAETQRLGGLASTAVSTAKDQAVTALDAHMEQKTEGLDLHAADLKAALTASLGTREEEAIGAVRIERDAALVVLREEGAQFREDLNTLAERSEDAAKRAACSAAITVKAASDVDEALTDTALDLLAPQVVAEAVRQATVIALDSANTATVEAEKSRQSAATACACADESAASAQGAADSAAAAETSAGAAADSASVAAASEAVATAKAGEASTSATAAKASENAAKASEQTATEAANTATMKAGEASVSAAAAGVSEANAAASATAAADSANVASAAQTAAEAACEETKKVAVLPATTTSRGSVKPDGLTISVTADGTISARDMAIGGNLEDLASARGQIGDYRTKLPAGTDLNDIISSGTYIVYSGNCTNVPMNGMDGYYVLRVFGDATNPNAAVQKIYSRMGTAGPEWSRRRISDGAWQPWQQLVQTNYIGDGIKISRSKALADGTGGLCIISVPEMQGATSAQAGVSGLVPPPLAADAGKVLGADGTWSFPKDVAIGGDLEDLASARGQIGDNIRINTASDLNTYTKAGNWLFSDAAAGENFPNIGRGGELNCYVSTTAIFQFFTEFNNNRRYIRYGIPNSTWTNWIQFISVAQLGDGIRNTNGIISVPEYEGATTVKAGTSGLVPPATAGQHESFLTGGGEYKPALTKISDSVSLADSTTAASAKAVKAAYDLANGKQAALGFTPVQQGGGANQYASKIYLGWDGGAVRVQVDGSDMGQLVTTLAGQQKAPNAAWADGAQFALRLRREGNVDTIWNWAGQGGQPGWLWGGNDGVNMYVYNPANFSVNYANGAGYANSAGSAPANGGTSSATITTPNVVTGNYTVPAGGSWAVLYNEEGNVRSGMYPGGYNVGNHIHLAIRVS
ncbi:pyocin knob domain-containing protein [Bilophila wadsworthia]|uniref:pyocin knob domain-containing protein n=1 Tax=Bilophila wadsworthia TaxID=35833 RepID=UPI00266B9FD3|nr:pyocin knob domain-containing protein [Bilophila wadsworthia]